MKISKRKALLLSGLILASSWSVISCERTTAAVSLQDKAADFTLKDENGKPYNFYENTKGKVVILNFWAKRCPACKAEVPALVKISKEFRDAGLEVIGVDVDGSGVSSMKNTAAQYGINYPLLSGSQGEIGKLVNDYGGFRFIPTTYIISRDGTIVEKVSGSKEKVYFESAVKKLL